jgi:LPXTG-site transpeptidase (sortase) family protein
MDNLIDRLWVEKVKFFTVFFVVFTVSYLFLVAIDFVPEAPAGDDAMSSTDETATTTEAIIDVEVVEEPVVLDDIGSDGQQILPVTIKIAKLNRSVTVLNPESRTIADLDTALLSGVVRHPDSATLGQKGNVFLLGHSSYLPVVLNSNFKAFNGIQDLVWGDIIELHADNHIFEYEVERVYMARAQDLAVPIAGEEKRLTIATCNSFGSADDRYMVEAKQVGVRTLGLTNQ